MLYLVNPKRRAKKRRAGGKKRRTAKQRAATRKLVALSRARARGTKKRRARRTPVMAKRRRKATTARRRRRSTRGRRRSPVTTLRRRSVYITNPRRRRRRGYRRNPGMGGGILNTTIGLFKASGAALVGGAAGRMASNLIPIGGSPIVNFAKGVIVAVGIKKLGSRFLGNELATYAAVGAMLGPTKDLITSFVPGATGFLGASNGAMYFPPPIYSNAGLAAYSGDVDGADVSVDTGMGAYSDGGIY